MGGIQEQRPSWRRPVLFAVFFLIGFCIFAVPNYVSGPQRNTYEVGLAVALGVLLMAFRKNKSLAPFKPVMLAFFTAAVAYASTYLIAHPYSLDSTVEAIAYQKVLDTFAVVVPIIVLVLASGAKLKQPLEYPSHSRSTEKWSSAGSL